MIEKFFYISMGIFLLSLALLIISAVVAVIVEKIKDMLGK